VSAITEATAVTAATKIEKLKYTIAKRRHQQFGQSSERGAILDQLVDGLAGAGPSPSSTTTGTSAGSDAVTDGLWALDPRSGRAAPQSRPVFSSTDAVPGSSILWGVIYILRTVALSEPFRKIGADQVAGLVELSGVPFRVS
jgi:hypothetical protein